MLQFNKELWRLGKEILFALPHESSVFHPSRSAIAAAARQFSVTQARARLALDYYLNS